MTGPDEITAEELDGLSVRALLDQFQQWATERASELDPAKVADHYDQFADQLIRIGNAFTKHADWVRTQADTARGKALRQSGRAEVEGSPATRRTRKRQESSPDQ